LHVKSREVTVAKKQKKYISESYNMEKLVIMEGNMQINHGEGRGMIFGWLMNSLTTLLAGH